MYCNNCGRKSDEYSTYCSNCGVKLDESEYPESDNYGYNIVFGFLGFLSPIIGLILFLVYEKKNPKRGNSAVKGAIIGFLSKIIISIVIIVLTVVLSSTSFSNITDFTQTVFADVLSEEVEYENDEDFAEVMFGEFKASRNSYSYDTELQVTVKNTTDERYTFFITIEAVDSDGARIDTDTLCADRLNAGQEIHLTAFDYVEEDKIDQFKNATFKVLDIAKYDA